MISKLKPKSEFTKNVLTLMTGTTIAQAIPIAISPILTRLYTPKDFGVFALFIAITSIFGSIVNGRYELAIMLPKIDEDAINIMALGFIINTALSLILLLIVIMFHDKIIDLLNNKEISFWLYLVPLSVFLIGCFNLLNYFNNRKKFYKDLAKANIYRSIGMVIVQLGLGFFKSGAAGLISGQIFSQIISNTKLFLNVKRSGLLKKINKTKIILLGKKYIEFPKFSMWAILANNLAQNLINILITFFYHIKTLGFYSLTQRIMGLPSSLIGFNLGQVFYQESSERIKNKKSIKKFFFKILIKLIMISIIIYGIIFIISPIIIPIIFGEKWSVISDYINILMFLFFSRFIVSPFTPIVFLFKKNKIDLIFQLGLLLLYLIIFIVFHVLPFLDLLKIISFVIGSYYLIYLFFIYFYFIRKDE